MERTDEADDPLPVYSDPRPPHRRFKQIGPPCLRFLDVKFLKPQSANPRTRPIKRETAYEAIR